MTDVELITMENQERVRFAREIDWNNRREYLLEVKRQKELRRKRVERRFHRAMETAAWAFVGWGCSTRRGLGADDGGRRVVCAGGHRSHVYREGCRMSRQKNMRRISVLVTAQTAFNLARLAAMDGGNQGRVIDKLVRDRMVMLKEAERMVRRHEQ